MSFQNLNKEQQKELEEWLVSKDIKLSHRVRRQLSDVVNMAQLFKNYDNKLVDMQFYTSHSGLELKLSNWENFNLKVLRKIGLKLTRDNLQDLAKGNVDALSGLLYHLMHLERDGLYTEIPSRCLSRAQSKDIFEPGWRKSYHSYLEWLNKQKVPAKENECIKNEHEKVDKQQLKLQEKQLQEAMLKDYEEQKLMINRKDDYINTLHIQAIHLKQVIGTKDARIHQLLEHLTKLTVQILSMQSHLESDRIYSEYGDNI